MKSGPLQATITSESESGGTMGKTGPNMFKTGFKTTRRSDSNEILGEIFVL